MSFSLLREVWPIAVVRGIVAGATARPLWALLDAVRALKGASAYSLLATIGIVFGFLRELVVASEFGLSPELDVFVVVMSVQLFFGVQIGNATETAFISKVPRSTVLSDLVDRLTQSLSSLVFLNIGIGMLLVFTSDVALQALFPAFDTHQHRLGLRMIQFLLLPIAFANMAGLLRAGLNVLGQFSLGFLAGTVISVTTIISVLVFAPYWGVDALVLGYASGHFLVLVLLATRLVLTKGVAATRSNWGGRGIWFLWGSAGMVLIGEVFYQAVVLIERSFASSLPNGSIAAFYYASTILSVPLFLVVVPLTTILFPRLVELFKQDSRSALGCLAKNSVLIISLGVGMAATITLFARPLVELLFVRGQFTMVHAEVTAGILTVTIWALPFVSMGRLLRISCYSLQEYRGPIIAVGIQALALLSLGTILVPRYGSVGLAVALVCGEAVMMGVMGVVLSYRIRKTAS